MSSAFIALEDHNGEVACKLTFTGGFDPESHAHQHAQILIGLMDKLCERKGEPVVDQVVDEVKPAVGVVEG